MVDKNHLPTPFSIEVKNFFNTNSLSQSGTYQSIWLNVSIYDIDCDDDEEIRASIWFEDVDSDKEEDKEFEMQYENLTDLEEFIENFYKEMKLTIALYKNQRKEKFKFLKSLIKEEK